MVALIHLIDGRKPGRPPIGFTIDCPWLPGWYGIDTIDYLGNQDLWFAAAARHDDVEDRAVR